MLKFLNKTWRKNNTDPNHVCNWPAWVGNNLPKSPTTIDRDIREGIPEQRIAAYARCLDISSTKLCSPQANMATLPNSQENQRKMTPEPSLPLGRLNRFPERYRQHNEPAYMRELFTLMAGVYRMDYLLQGIHLIHRCTLWIYEMEEGFLRMRGKFIMFGNENPLEATIFRWHHNLHTHFLCDNGRELGYTMSVDPLRFDQVRQRRPFWLRGTGMTDRGLEDNQPITFTYRMNQLHVPNGMTAEQLWQQENQDMGKRPFRSPGEKNYDAIWTSILTPEELP